MKLSNLLKLIDGMLVKHEKFDFEIFLTEIFHDKKSFVGFFISSFYHRYFSSIHNCGLITRGVSGIVL